MRGGGAAWCGGASAHAPDGQRARPDDEQRAPPDGESSALPRAQQTGDQDAVDGGEEADDGRGNARIIAPMTASKIIRGPVSTK